MAGPSFALAFILCRLSLVGLFSCLVRADPSLECPEYVAAHAPLLWLHSDDPFMPSDLLAHVKHTTPVVHGEPIGGLPTLDLNNLEVLNNHGSRVALASNDDPISYPDWVYGEAPDDTGRIRNSTPCVVIIVEKSELDVDAFYFYFYSYNEGPNITQVLEPLDRLVRGSKADSGMHFGDHIGDWEHNMVRFIDGKPSGIYFSQHVDGVGYHWDDSKLTIEDGRPIVYSACGSHANYATPGNQIHNAALVDYCDAGRRWDPVLSAYFYRFNPENFTVTPLAPPKNTSPPPPSDNLTSFFYFTGIWGDEQYPDADPRQEKTPYFGLRRFLDGPTGPRWKHLVRKGLRPDNRRTLSWREWGVGVFMSWYPCCIRGWRKWVYLGMIFLVVAVIVIGVRIGIRRYRNRAYRKIRNDDIYLDDWREDEVLFSSSDEEEEGENHHR